MTSPLVAPETTIVMDDVATVQFKSGFKSPEWSGEEVWIGSQRVGTLYTYPQPEGLPKLIGSHWGQTHEFENRREAAFWFTRIYHAIADAM